MPGIFKRINCSTKHELKKRLALGEKCVKITVLFSKYATAEARRCVTVAQNQEGEAY